MADRKIALGIGLVAALVAGIAMVVRGGVRPPLPPEDIRVSDLVINPALIYPGDRVMVSCTVTNVGGALGSYEVILGGDFMARKTVNLNPGQSAEVSFQVIPDTLGSYQVEVDGLTGSFTCVEAPVPPGVADIRLSNLVIQPSVVYVGETVTISVTATNQGDAAGSREIQCVVM